MNKIAILVLADSASHEGLGRVANALETAKEFKEANDDVRVIFEGAGTTWLPKLAQPDHKAHALYRATREAFYACSYCASAFGVKEQIQKLQVPLLSEYDGHPSIRNLVSQGYHVITY